MMTDVAVHVLTKVNAPYGVDLSAHQLAAMIVDSKSATEFNGSVFAFFSEIPEAMQKAFLDSMGVDEAQARKVANQFSKLSGYALPLAA